MVNEVEQPSNSASEAFKKVDFHIHTPGSKCYSDPQVDPEQIVNMAIEVGLEAIAVTDHNTVAGVDSIRKLGNEKGLVVFPGIELSTRQGHVLGLFDRDMHISRLDDFLDYVGAGAAAKGDGSVFVGDWIGDVFQKIEECGGIAIAAHIERWPTGFLQTNESRKVKMKIHGSEHLSALEITQPQNKGRWNRGQMKHYPKRYACIQGSDAHALADIGRRPTYLKLPFLDLGGLRLAFSEYEERIRFPREMATHARETGNRD